MFSRLRSQRVKFSDPELEKRWEEEAGERLQRGINWGTAIVGMVLILSIARDLILQWDGWEGLMLFRLGVITPLILLPWILSRTPLGIRHRADIVLVSLSALFLAMAVMFIWMPALPGASKPLVSILFLPVFAAATTLFPIGARRTLVLATTGLVAFLLAYSQVDTSWLRFSLMSWTVFALAGILVGGSWRLEQQERLLWQAKHHLETEQENSLRLLQNVFPAPIAERLLKSEAPIADRYESLVVIFADVVGFTPMAHSMTAARLVEQLDELFKDFDAVVQTHRFTKVKTIGDAYMVVGGLPWEPRGDREISGACLAWDLMTCAMENHDLKLRIGIHTGPGVAGVIGDERFIYDFWGDTVNVASRLESTAEVGRIQISAAMVNNPGFEDCVKRRGLQELKGVGTMETFWLVSRPV